VLTAEERLSAMAKELQVKDQELVELQEQLYNEKRSHQNLLSDYEHALGILSKIKPVSQEGLFAF
jgi:hypothetical protein